MEKENIELTKEEKEWILERRELEQGSKKEGLYYICLDLHFPNSNKPILIGSTFSKKVVETSDAGMITFAFANLKTRLILKLKERKLWKDKQSNSPKTKEVKSED